MSHTVDSHAPPLLSGTELESVLAAWQDATQQLEQTHRALREEVKRLTDELQVKNRELARKDRLADLGQMASHVAHEVRNNLVPVSLYMSMLRRRFSSDLVATDLLAKVQTGLTALDAVVHDLLGFTSDREPRWTRFALAHLVDDVLSSLEPQLTAQAIEIDCRMSEGIEISADRDMIRRAVLNLALNAIDAMPEGGRITISALDDSHGVELQIADTGPGVSDDVQRRAFEPFFTTKNTGTGLGLAIVYRVADAHGGCCSLTNHIEGGAVFSLRLPHRPCQEAAA